DAGAPAVDIGRVEELNAGLQRAVHDRERILRRRKWTEVHRAETNAADAETGAAKMGRLHVTSREWQPDRYLDLAGSPRLRDRRLQPYTQNDAYTTARTEMGREGVRV